MSWELKIQSMVGKQRENPTLGAEGGVMAIKALHDGYQKIPVDDKVRSGDIISFKNFVWGSNPCVSNGARLKTSFRVS